MIVSPAEALLTFAKLAVVGVVPGFLFTLGLFPKMPITQRVALGGALSLALPALVETLAGHYAGLRLTKTVAVTLTLAVASVGLLAWPRRRDWREWFTPWPGTTRWTIAAVVGLLVLGAFLNFKPHIGYDLPIHRDEWQHYDDSAAIVRAGGNVSAGLVTSGLKGFERHPEAGFHALLVHSYHWTGSMWDPLIVVWPTFVYTLLLVALFAVTAPYGYGVEALVMGLVLPTSLRVLGPQFAVPLALGLFLIPVAYLLFMRAELMRPGALVALLLVYTWIAHPPSALAMAFLMAGYAGASAKRNVKRAAAFISLAAFPFVLGRMEAPERLVDAESILNQAPTLPIPSFVDLFGVPALLLFAVGVFVALHRLKAEQFGWLAASVIHLGIIWIYLSLSVGVSILYDRAWMHGILTMSITSAAGLGAALLWARRHDFGETFPVGRLIAVLLMAVVLTSGLVSQVAREADYYRVITPAERADFAWIRDNVVLMEGETAALEASKGTAFSAITGLRPLSKSWADSPPLWLHSFLAEGATDDSFIDRHRVALVYSPYEVVSPRFEEIRPGIFKRLG